MKSVKRLLWLAVLLLVFVIAFGLPNVLQYIGDGNYYAFAECYYCLPAVFALVYGGVVFGLSVEAVKMAFFFLLGSASLVTSIYHVLLIALLFFIFLMFKNKLLGWIVAVLAVTVAQIAFIVLLGPTGMGLIGGMGDLGFLDGIWMGVVFGLYHGVVMATFYCVCYVSKLFIKPSIDGEPVQIIIDEDKSPQEDADNEPVPDGQTTGAAT